jgi:hypothetical protein
MAKCWRSDIKKQNGFGEKDKLVDKIPDKLLLSMKSSENSETRSGDSRRLSDIIFSLSVNKAGEDSIKAHEILADEADNSRPNLNLLAQEGIKTVMRTRKYSAYGSWTLKLGSLLLL